MKSRRFLPAMITLAAAVGCSSAGGEPPESLADPGSPVVDVVYLDHSPVRSAVAEVDEVLRRYEGDITIRRHAADSEEGQELAERNGASGHVVLLVLIDGESDIAVDGRMVRFEGFPVGTAPVASAQGEWSVDMLDTALADQVGPS